MLGEVIEPVDIVLAETVIAELAGIDQGAVDQNVGLAADG